MCTLLLLCTCADSDAPRYGEDLQAARRFTEAVELTGGDGQQRLLVVPGWQGRILTSTYGGMKGASNGYFSRQFEDLGGMGIGGEDQLRFTPLGSQHSPYIPPTDELNELNAVAPAALAEAAFEVVERGQRQVVLHHDYRLVNHVGAAFSLSLDRRISLLTDGEILSTLHLPSIKGIPHVAFRSEHRLINTARGGSTDATGLIGIWSVGSFAPSESASVVFPLQRAAAVDELLLYPPSPTGGRVRVDGAVASFGWGGGPPFKVGIPHRLARECYGYYDPARERLTIIRYSLPGPDRYGNTDFSVRSDPYAEEVIAATRAKPGYCELSSTSAIRPLPRGAQLYHFHEVYHFSGSPEVLDRIAREVLRTGLPAPH